MKVRSFFFIITTIGFLALPLQASAVWTQVTQGGVTGGPVPSNALAPIIPDWTIIPPCGNYWFNGTEPNASQPRTFGEEPTIVGSYNGERCYDDFDFWDYGAALHIIMVWEWSGGVTPPPPPPPPTGPVCGNWVTESGEQCDDGNTWGGDGCSGVCTIEVAGPPGGCTVPAGGFANSIISDCASSAGYTQGSDFNSAYVIDLGWSNYRVCQDQNTIPATVCSNGDFIWQGSAMCNPPPYCSINGQCGASNNVCVAGVLNDIPDDTSNYRWICLGQGGSDAYCSAPIPAFPVDGVCGWAVDVCDAGSYEDLSDTLAAYRWRCNGQAGGWTATCNLPTPPDISGPGGIDFGIVAIGSSRTIPVTITNQGGLPANITFSPPGSANLSGGTMSFDPISVTVDPLGGTATIDVTYTAGPGAFSGSLSGWIMVSGANTIWISVDGSISSAPSTEIQVEQVGVGVISDPHNVNIGALNPAAPSVAYDFVIRNLTLTPMTFDVSILGGWAAGYTLVPQTSEGCGGGGPIVAGDVRVCRVIFDPDTSIVGNRPATIVFDNTTSGAISGDDPVRVNMDALVSGGSLADVGSSGPIPVTNPSSNNFELDFGSRPIGGVYAQQIGITNTGDAVLTGSYTNLFGTFTTIGSQNVSVNPWGAPHLITVEFRPTAPGPVNDLLVIDADAANFGPSGDIRITVKGSGNVSPDLDVIPEGQGPRSWNTGNANLPFNDQEIYLGPTEQKSISVTDVVGVPTTITAISSNAAFTVVPASLNLPANGSGDFVVTFDPDLPPGINSGSIMLDASGIGPNFTVFTNGRGFVNPPSLDVPDPFPFGRVVLSKTKELDITIRSLDSRPLSFAGIGNPLGDAAFTCVSANCGAPFTLNQNETQTFTLRFTPTMVGAYSGTLQLDVINVGMVDPGPITLTGTGIQPVIRYEER